MADGHDDDQNWWKTWFWEAGGFKFIMDRWTNNWTFAILELIFSKYRTVWWWLSINNKRVYKNSTKMHKVPFASELELEFRFYVKICTVTSFQCIIKYLSDVVFLAVFMRKSMTDYNKWWFSLSYLLTDPLLKVRMNISSL